MTLLLSYWRVENFRPWFNSLSTNPTKWSNTLTIRQQIADELFECVSPFCGVGA